MHHAEDAAWRTCFGSRALTAGRAVPNEGARPPALPWPLRARFFACVRLSALSDLTCARTQRSR
eukprot:4137660-Prymnesium_polylepis.1